MAQRTLRCPFLATGCSECGGKVGLSYWSLVSLLPFLLTIGIHRLLLDELPPDRIAPVNFFLGGLGAGLSMVWALMWPLQKRESIQPPAEDRPNQ
jgi:hypothetical protein